MLAFGADNSAKLSAHLAAGCLSPRMVHAAVMDASATQGAEQCGWLVMHLIIRCVADGRGAQQLPISSRFEQTASALS